ncbi:MULTISPECIES: cysteine hydrolase family protein [Bacillaceae]|uniref:cysteine hydrolase family protein n=1 Tax=Bacillaceae TaxID=186817 RepID=UPI000BEE39E3|nr:MULTISPECIES: cysteine hydrolase family protein [unclassified Bacillus (in: firmicutes)]PEC50256.1 cysteine hydrolase [Bacillus sp. AFS096315]PET44899.1 cysteine hydrolase [Bacillus sp. AFS001701]
MYETYTALLIVDIQAGSFRETEPLFKGDELLKNVQLLISKARLTQTPIVYMKYNDGPGKPLEQGTSGWEIHSSITPLVKDIIIEKDYPDSFHMTNLHQELAARKIKRIVITGIQSEVCVDATCRRAYSLGYEVILVKDGHSTYNSKILPASQIIDHHNDILGQWFSVLKKADEIEF